ncbi:unnamed protein product [Timema podura]|uniref:Metaxin n=1 Tax=Timema podura TaxID=61482 RepID=A0ABN7NP14_TIMPD|nr:unnamed protein product [Timema podura]
MNRPMELDVWAGDWGLPSIDLHCLQVMAYAKFSGVPIQMHVTNNPFRSPSGKLPVFRHGKVTLSTYTEIVAYLTKKKFSADFGLTPRQHSEVVAYSQLLQERLLPALNFIWWLNERNHQELTRPWYCKALPWPLNFYYPGSYERNARALINTMFDEFEEPSVVENGLYTDAERCLTALSHRLGESEFFLGAHPTSLDATVYAYLAPLLKAPFPCPALQNHLKACTNLVKFVVRVTQRYFPTAAQEYEAKRHAEEIKKTRESEKEFPHKRRNQLLATLFAFLAMVGYALSTGLVQVSAEYHELDNSDDYDEVPESDSDQ